MDINKRVEVMEGELKLMKDELKQTLTNVRDFLLGLDLQPMPEEKLLSIETQDLLPISGRLSMEPSSNIPQPPPETAKVPSNIPQPPPETAEKQVEYERLEELSDEALPETIQGKRNREEPSQRAPQANLLANLMHWISVAKREIGSEQLPTLLKVYEISGYLSPELKQVILHLADVIAEQAADTSGANVWSRMIREQLDNFLEVHSISGELSPELKEGILHFVNIMAQQSANTNNADVWSRLILELHGILTLGGVPLRPLKPLWDGDGDKAQQEEKPIKLKLVLPVSGGMEKEFSLALTPEVDSSAIRELPGIRR